MRAKIDPPKSMKELKALDYEKIKDLWRRYFKDPPLEDTSSLPDTPLRPDYRTLRTLWYKIQCETYNLHLEQKNITKLNRYSTDPEKFLEQSCKTRYQLKSGMEIVKTYKGQLYKVYVKSPKEFIYNDQSFKTLSAVALVICKNKVSGYDFFGLNNKSYEKGVTEEETFKERNLEEDDNICEEKVLEPSERNAEDETCRK